ncbi:hypothetical protein SODALDRAFT_331271 [Sodiomyces alkalinus F11]|uniref:Uncharacterized protein n=1 Tax=Sodiomyces alkalinus (strain CBS 110278 / VKM F-3762 / F11) TaxID=1314773 RepID=A0A3N2Q446_SODAK|nr:hypothetical protein SODALDRAFT_331271 [Sodiomyces alkalinus F11]ROT41530.1 hypothetical protein SODALDRAFT_331271 [Sodiomyces alkalinus F11]
MGLPLFVAPVDSDIEPNSPEKVPDVPPRTSIRRSRRPNNRESRTLRRRAAFLRESFPTYDLEAPSIRFAQPWDSAGFPPPSDPPARYPWIESGQPPPPEAYRSNPAAPRPAHGAHRSGRTARARVGTSSENPTIASLLGDRYAVVQTRTSVSPPPEGAQPSSRSRLVSRHARPGDMDLSDVDGYRRDRIAPSVAARFDRSPDRGSLGSLRWLQSSESSASRRDRLSRATHRHGSHRSTGLDGLGDRTRSLSPEVWDTLLTTLTPDPQPPSVESSFTSASASASASTSQHQGAATSSRTSFPIPDMAYDHVGEHPCENSDSEYDEPMGAMFDGLDRLDMSFVDFPVRRARRLFIPSNAHDSEMEWEAARRAVVARLWPSEPGRGYLDE